MASLFEHHPGEVHFYPNRKPRHDGAQPFLGWQWIVFFFGVLCFSVVAFMIQYGLFLSHIVKFLFEAFLLFLCVRFLVLSGVKTVFSAQKKQVWSSFLFFKWNVVPWRELGDIRLRDQEIMGKQYYSYVFTRKNKFLPPVRLSHPCLDTDQLALFTHAAVPLLEEYFPSDSAAAEVEVIHVEVPVEHAEAMLAGEGDVRRTANTTSRIKKLKFFTNKEGVFRISLRTFNIGLFLGLLGIAAAVTLLSVFQHESAGAYVTWTIYGVIVVLAILVLPDLNMDMNIDLKNRLFIYHTKFGRKENVVPFEALLTFNMKEETCGMLRLCMVLEGVMINPNLVITGSPDTIKAVYKETCSILNLNPDAWFDG